VDPPSLKRSLFGYKSRDVRFLIADRDKTFIQASEAAASAESRALELQELLDTATADIAEKAGKLKEAEHAIEELRASVEAANERSDKAAEHTRELEAQQERLQRLLDEARGDARGVTEQLSGADRKLEVLERELADVRAVIEPRTEELRVAQGKVAELEETLATTQRRSDELTRELETERRRAEEAQARAAELVGTGSPADAQGLTSILDATQEAVGRLVEQARRMGEEQLGEAQRERDLILAEVEQLTAWRERLEPAIGAVRNSIRDTQARVEEVSDRVREALEPITGAMTALGSRLGELVQAGGSTIAPETAAAGGTGNGLHEPGEEGPGTPEQQPTDEIAWWQRPQGG
jgi:predicted  nucleic acid-binding Zn-ribbon protein